MLNKMEISNFDPVTLGKNDRGRGLVALQFSWSPTKGATNFNFRSDEPASDNLALLGRYNHHCKKETKNTRS